MLLCLLLEVAEVHCQQLHALAMAPLLPHGPHCADTLLRVEQRHILLVDILLLMTQTKTQGLQQSWAGNSSSDDNNDTGNAVRRRKHIV